MIKAGFPIKVPRSVHGSGFIVNERNQDGIYRPGSESDEEIPWNDPLTEPVEAIEFLNMKIPSSEYPFLTGFLCRKRRVDLPFEKRHQLITFVLNTIQESCYDFMRSNFPEQLQYTRIYCSDAIDIFDWIAFIEVRSTPLSFHLAKHQLNRYRACGSQTPTYSAKEPGPTPPSPTCQAPSQSATSDTPPCTANPTARA